MRRLLAAAALTALVPASAAAARSDPNAELSAFLKGRVAQAPVRCITISPGDASSTIITGRAIVWRNGTRLFVNVPRGRAEMLDADDLLVTEPFASQLCRNDRVTPVSRLSRIPRAPLFLGMFTPYVRPAGKAPPAR